MWKSVCVDFRACLILGIGNILIVLLTSNHLWREFKIKDLFSITSADPNPLTSENLILCSVNIIHCKSFNNGREIWPFRSNKLIILLCQTSK